MDKVGGEEEGEIYGESNIEIYNAMCKTDSQREFAVRLRKRKQGLCDRLKGGVGREMQGRSGRGQGVPMADSWCMTESHKIL